MARFFIDRPVFAWVLAIITMMAGVLAIYTLPIEQYPKVAPPTVTISAAYPGASAETVENSVTQVIEQSLSGIDNMRYFSASSSNSSVSISLTLVPTLILRRFKPKTKYRERYLYCPLKYSSRGLQYLNQTALLP